MAEPPTIDLPIFRIADLEDPKNPEYRVAVKDPNNLTDQERQQVEKEVRRTNPNLPNGTTISVGKDGKVTITYMDDPTRGLTSTDTIPGNVTTITIPAQKVPVLNPNQLTAIEKIKVTEQVRKANPNLTNRDLIMISNDGTATVHYEDGSIGIISGHDLVEKSATVPAEKPVAPRTPTSEPSTNTSKAKLPNTGEQTSASTIALGIMSAFAGLGLVAKKRKQEEDEE